MLPTLPVDFPGRLRAARAYIDKTRAEFAALLDVPGASPGNLKAYEGGTRNPPPLAAPALVSRLAEVTGLPETFFWGDGIDPNAGSLEKHLSGIHQQLRLLRAEVVVGDAEGMTQAGAGPRAADRGAQRKQHV
jgi:transcriptional regulator with XRE-family HTH domain